MSVLRRWRELNRFLKALTILGVLGGIWALWFISFWTYSIGTFRLPLELWLWYWLGVYFAAPVIGLLGALTLLLRDMSKRRRDIVGLVVLVTSVPTVFYMIELGVIFLTGIAPSGG